MLFSRGKVMSARSLLEPVLNGVTARLGWPDDEVFVRVRSPKTLCAALEECLAKFREYWANTDTVIDVSVNTYHWKLDVRVKQLAVEPESSEGVPSLLRSPFARLDRAARAGKGEAYYWGTNNYFGLMLPIERSSDAEAERENFPKLKANEWDAAYREELIRTSWPQLRGKAFRFCNFATAIAHSLGRREASILVPSVGLCAHPWVFAQAQHRVVATDISPTALETVSHPERWARIYGSAAQDRWDISQLCLYSGTAHPEAFPPMAAVEREEVASELRSRITFAEADWAQLPVESGTIDVVFATNALPRDDNRLMEQVIAEWRRVLKPNGHLFVLMHNAAWGEINAALARHDWSAVDSFDATATRPTYRLYYSSG